MVTRLTVRLNYIINPNLNTCLPFLTLAITFKLTYKKFAIFRKINLKFLFGLI